MHAEQRKRKRERLNPSHRSSSLVPFPLTCSFNPSCIQANTCPPGPLAFQEQDGSHGPVLRDLCIFLVFISIQQITTSGFQVSRFMSILNAVCTCEKCNKPQISKLGFSVSWPVVVNENFHTLEGTSCL